MKIKSFFLLIFVSVYSVVNAQQDPMFTHYMYNTLWLNPAYAGTREALTLTAIHRSQWVGFDGAPVDQTFTMHAPFYDAKMGAGLSVINDRIGPTKSTIIAGDYAYQLKLDNKSKLGFGLKGLINIFNNNINTLKLDNQVDVAFASNYQLILPNVGAGLYYHRDRFYAGLSTPKFIQNKLSNGSTASTEQRHYFIIVGGVVKLDDKVKFKPTAFFKATNAAPLEADLTANFLIQDRFTAGLMYRTGDAFGALLSYSFKNAFTLGYSFDWSTANTTGKYNSGSHEIMLRYDVSLKKTKIKSPRYF